MAAEEASRSLMDIIKDKAYHIINKFEEVLPKGQPYADWDQFKQVMFTYTKNEEELAQFWSQTHIDSKFFYYDTIIAVTKPPSTNQALAIYQDF
jgi:hypothetical protein